MDRQEQKNKLVERLNLAKEMLALELEIQNGSELTTEQLQDKVETLGNKIATIDDEIKTETLDVEKEAEALRLKQEQEKVALEAEAKAKAEQELRFKLDEERKSKVQDARNKWNGNG